MCVSGRLMFSLFALMKALKHFPINELLVCNWPVQLAGYMISGNDECFIAYKQFYSLILYYLTEDLVFDDNVILKTPAELLPCKDVDYPSWKYFLKPKQTKPKQTARQTPKPKQTKKLPKLLVATQVWGFTWNYARCGHPRAHVEALKLKSPFDCW